jgi:hypothetical protein
MDDPLGGEPEPACGLGVARGAPAQLLAGLLELSVTGSPVDGPVDAASAGQGLVGGIDHRVDLLGRDIALNGLNIHDVILLLRSFVAFRALSPCARRLNRDLMTRL